MNDPIEYAGNQIDKIITMDLSSRGSIDLLYGFARKATGGPLALTAARRLAAAPKEGPSFVFIATGFPDRPHVNTGIAETDGPPGAVALARALHLAYRATPIILVEESLVAATKCVLEASGLRCVEPQEAAVATTSHAPIHAASVLPFPTETEEARRYSSYLISTYNPWAIVCTEKAGMNDRGVIHTVRGRDITQFMGKIDYLMIEARNRGILTIGVGDGGNEVGMGVIQEEIKRAIPMGARCECGCGSGFAPAVATDLLVAAAVSNWGCYGIAACVAILEQNARVFHDRDTEQAILEACARNSFIDGCTGYVGPSVDGIPMSVHLGVVEMLGRVIASALKRPW